MGEASRSGPIYIIAGDSGRKPRTVKYQSPLPGDWLESIDNEHNSYGTVQLMNATHARWRRIVSSANETETGGILWEEAMIANQYYATTPLPS
mmetsp:Transcript_16254/g.25370  ORF Transcript_16254/g.25370 Transcript_16254/m.25370 type:complete len:93 (-) Transcript_16254:743-1021(-)